MSQLWVVTNVTGTNVAFDDKTLAPATATSVARLTDDIASGVYQGKLTVTPLGKGSANNNFGGCITLNPATLPLPVKLIGQHATPESLVVVDKQPAIICQGKPCMILEADTRRRSFTLRNGSPTDTLAIGGRNVALDTSVRILPPGATLTETLAASAEWYAVSNNNSTRLLLSLVLAQANIC